MDSMVMRSPPTSRAIDARSSVVAMTFNLPCARDGVATRSAAASAPTMILVFINTFFRTGAARVLERVRPVRPDRELELEQELVRRWPDRVLRPAVLPAHLAELARPVRQDERLAGIQQRRIVGVVRPVISQ